MHLCAAVTDVAWTQSPYPSIVAQELQYLARQTISCLHMSATNHTVLMKANVKQKQHYYTLAAGCSVGDSMSSCASLVHASTAECHSPQFLSHTAHHTQHTAEAAAFATILLKCAMPSAVMAPSSLATAPSMTGATRRRNAQLSLSCLYSCLKNASGRLSGSEMPALCSALSMTCSARKRKRKPAVGAKDTARLCPQPPRSLAGMDSTVRATIDIAAT